MAKGSKVKHGEEMSEPRKKTDWSIAAGLILALLVMVLLGLYVWGYYTMGGVGSVTLDPGGPATVRVYNAQWKAGLFTPAAKVESLLRGRQVFIEVSDVWQLHDAF